MDELSDLINEGAPPILGATTSVSPSRLLEAGVRGATFGLLGRPSSTIPEHIAEFVGSIPTYGGVAKIGGKLIAPIIKNVVGAKLATAAATGAVAGGIQGYASGEGATEEALTQATLGAAAEGAFLGAGKLYRMLRTPKVKPPTSTVSPSEKAVGQRALEAGELPRALPPGPTPGYEGRVGPQRALPLPPPIEAGASSMEQRMLGPATSIAAEGMVNQRALPAARVAGVLPEVSSSTAGEEAVRGILRPVKTHRQYTDELRARNYLLGQPENYQGSIPFSRDPSPFKAPSSIPTGLSQPAIERVSDEALLPLVHQARNNGAETIEAISTRMGVPIQQARRLFELTELERLGFRTKFVNGEPILEPQTAALKAAIEAIPDRPRQVDLEGRLPVSVTTDPRFDLDRSRQLYLTSNLTRMTPEEAEAAVGSGFKVADLIELRPSKSSAQLSRLASKLNIEPDTLRQQLVAIREASKGPNGVINKDMYKAGVRQFLRSNCL